MTLAEQVATLRRTLIRRLSHRIGERTSRPFTQLLALKCIDVEGLRTQAALAERLMVDAPAVSRMVDRLEKDGLVRRGAGADRRCVRLEVTPEGQDQLSILKECGQAVDDEIRQHLSSTELHELKRLLEKVQLSLNAGVQAA